VLTRGSKSPIEKQRGIPQENPGGADIYMTEEEVTGRPSKRGKANKGGKCINTTMKLLKEISMSC
jgi:hypothetical protein